MVGSRRPTLHADRLFRRAGPSRAKPIRLLAQNRGGCCLRLSTRQKNAGNAKAGLACRGVSRLRPEILLAMDNRVHPKGRTSKKTDRTGRVGTGFSPYINKAK